MNPVKRSAVQDMPRISSLLPGNALSEWVVFDAEADKLVFGAWKNVLIAIWKAQATGVSVARFEKSVAQMVARTPGMRSNVHVILPGAGLPTAEAREGFAALMKRNRDSVASVAIVVGGAGFWASAIRSAMTSIRMLAQEAVDYRLVGSVDEVVDWLPASHEAKTGVRLDPAQLRAVLHAAPSSTL